MALCSAGRVTTSSIMIMLCTKASTALLILEVNLVSEYNEMAMQFGFITLFSSAFPLAPLCAMINNLFEIRQDAQKYTKYKTRPIPTRVPDIGIWYSIFQFLSVLAVITNVSLLSVFSLNSIRVCTLQ